MATVSSDRGPSAGIRSPRTRLSGPRWNGRGWENQAVLRQIRALLALITAIVVTAVADHPHRHRRWRQWAHRPPPRRSSSSTSSSTSTSTPVELHVVDHPGLDDLDHRRGRPPRRIPGPGTAGEADFTRLRFVITNAARLVHSFALEGVPIRASRGGVDHAARCGSPASGPTLLGLGERRSLSSTSSSRSADEEQLRARTCKSRGRRGVQGRPPPDDRRRRQPWRPSAERRHQPRARRRAWLQRRSGSTSTERICSLSGPPVWPALADPRRGSCLAMYFPWFSAADFARDFGDSPVPGVPLDTTSPAVVADAVNAGGRRRHRRLLSRGRHAPFSSERPGSTPSTPRAGRGDFEVALISTSTSCGRGTLFISGHRPRPRLRRRRRRGLEPAQLESMVSRWCSCTGATGSNPADGAGQAGWATRGSGRSSSISSID